MNPKEELANKIEDDISTTGRIFDDALKESVEKIKSEIECLTSTLYSDYTPWMASDLYQNIIAKYNTWIVSNYYQATDEMGHYTAKSLRQRIYQENKDEIINQLDQDNLEKIESLEKRVFDLTNDRHW